MKKWERPYTPSGQLERILILAEKFRAIEQAPSVRTDHFLLAFILETYPPIAKDILDVLENVKAEWEVSNVKR